MTEEAQADNKQKEIDDLLKDAIVTFGDITGSCFKYGTEEEISELLSTVEKLLQSGANINQEVKSEPKIILSHYVIKGLQKM